MRIMLDSNVHDLIVADQAVLCAIKRRLADGQLTLVSTSSAMNRHSLLSRSARPCWRSMDWPRTYRLPARFGTYLSGTNPAGQQTK